MASPTLKSRIDKLINDLGENPKPGPVDIRNRLTTFSTLAEALESGQSTVEAEQKIAVMEATIKELEAKLHGAETQLQSAHSEGEKLQRALDAVRGEIEQLRSDEKDQEKDAELEDGPAAALLAISGFRHGGSSYNLSRKLEIGEQLATHYLETLLDAGLVQFTPGAQKEYTDPRTGVRQEWYAPPSWQIAKKGRAYLAKRGLLQ